MDRLLKAASRIVPITSLLLATLLTQLVPAAVAAQLQPRSLQVANADPGATTRYTIHFAAPTAGTIGSIKAEFCDNTALFTESCNPPNGFSLSAASLSAQSGLTGFSIDPSSTANSLILSRPPAAQAGNITADYVLDGVVNAASVGSQYVRYSVFASNDASGPETDLGSAAYVLSEPLNVSTEVPPYLQLCVAVRIASVDCSDAQGNYLNMGLLRTGGVSTGVTQFDVSTNAMGGYAMYVGGSSMTSGNNVIPALAAPTRSIPGANQFGINLRSNSVPAVGQDPSGAGSGQPSGDYGQPNLFTYRSGDMIAANGHVEDWRKYTVSYVINISRDQPPGVYSSSFSYVAAGNF